MKNITLLLALIIICASHTHGQTNLVKQWDKRFGGTEGDAFSCLTQTPDGGYILAGSTSSTISGDKSAPVWGSADYWIVKITANGIKQWDKSFGGANFDEFKFFEQTPDKGYILAGTSNSLPSGNKSSNTKGLYDYWIVKIDSAGNKQWDRSFGGTGEDDLLSVIVTSDGGFLLGGDSRSNISGDKTEANRDSVSYTADYWIVKVDSLGNKEWDKCFGGNYIENLTVVKQCHDGTYIIGGYSKSGANGDKTQTSWSNQVADFWIVKTDPSGNKLWDKRYGGIKQDYLYSLQETSDYGFILAGASESGISGDKTENNRDSTDYFADYWMIKIDSTGNKLWDKRFGGNVNDMVDIVSQTADGGYLLSGWAYSDSSPDKSQNNLGNAQSWLVKTNSQGSMEWELTILEPCQTNSNVSPMGYGIQTSDGCYVVGNQTNGGIGGVKTQPKWGTIYTPDYWAIKYCDSAMAVANFRNDIIGTDITCQGLCNGSADANVSYGIPPYRYLWSTGDTTSTINNLCGGAYNVTVTDAILHTLTGSVVIVEPANAIYLTSTTDTSSRCVSNGAATVTATGGNGTYTYLWNNGNTTAAISNVSWGTYRVTVTSGVCIAVDTVIIARYPTLSATATATHTTCGNANGIVSINATGGNGNYTYIWNTGDTTATVSNLAAGGNYSFTVSSAQCTYNTFKAVNSSTPISANLTLSGNFCTSNIIAAPGGGGTGPYNYTWNTGEITSTIWPDSQGYYSVTISNAMCSVTDSIFVDETLILSFTTITSPTNCGFNNGGIVLMPSRIGSYSYIWNNGATTQHIHGLSPGTYTVTITEGLCTSTATATVQPSVANSITITASDTTLCYGDSALLCAPLGYQNYIWNTIETEPCIYAKSSGVYSVTVTDDTCMAISNTIGIHISPLLVATLVLPDTICANSAPVPISANPSGGILDGWAVANDTFQTVWASYGYNYVLYTFTDTNQCVTELVDSVWLHNCTDTCNAFYTIHPDGVTPSNWYLLNHSAGLTPLTFFWQWGDGTSDTAALATHQYSTPGYYNICLTVSDTTGCADTYCDSSVYIYKTDEIITVNVVNELPTSIKNVTGNLKITVYPNPATDKLKINSGGQIVEHVRLYNIQGQFIGETKLPANNLLDISYLTSGVYLAEIKVRDTVQRIRWIKM